MLDLLGGVPREQLLHLRRGGIERAPGERAFRHDRGEVLGGGRRGEPELRRGAVLEPRREPLVAFEELVDLVALVAHDLVEFVMRVGVPAFLAEEALDLAAQHRVVDLVEEVLHGAHEEPFAVGEQHVDAVRDRRGDRRARHPVPGHVREVHVEIARDDRLSHGPRVTTY